jgi:hypothetical protein
MLEDKIGHRGEGIEDSEIRVRLDPIEYDVGIKVGGFSGREGLQMYYEPDNLM